MIFKYPQRAPYHITGASYSMVEILDVVIRLGFVIATAFLFSIVAAAYIRLRNRKLMLISLGFGVFFIHALLTLPELLVPPIYNLNENTSLLIHVIGLTFILIGTLKD